MLRLTHIFIVIFCMYVFFNTYVSNTIVTPPPTTTFIHISNRLNNFWYEQNHNLERKYPSFEPFRIFKFCVTSFLFILLYFTIFLHLCNSVSFVTFSTNLTLNRKRKGISTPNLPQSITPVSLLLVWLLSAESPENYNSILIILPDLDYRNIFSLALSFRKVLFQIFFTILSIYIYILATTPSACFYASQYFKLGAKL